MTEDVATVYERDFYISVDDALPDVKKCFRVWWVKNASGESEIIKYTELNPSER